MLLCSYLFRIRKNNTYNITIVPFFDISGSFSPEELLIWNPFLFNKSILFIVGMQKLLLRIMSDQYWLHICTNSSSNLLMTLCTCLYNYFFFVQLQTFTQNKEYHGDEFRTEKDVIKMVTSFFLSLIKCKFRYLFLIGKLIS